MQQTSVSDGSLDSAASASRSGHAYGEYFCYAALLVALAAFGTVRFHFRSLPLERDEGEYAYMGQLMLQGVPPYQLAFTMKLPGTCAAYAAMMAVFGQTPAGIRLGMIVVTTLCAILVFLLGKRLDGSLAGTIAAITYIFLAIRPGVLGLEGHATHFVVLTALAGILVILQAIGQERVSLFFASGLLFGLSFLMKQPGIFFALFAGCYWLLTEWKRGLLCKNLALRGGAFVAGFVFPYGLLCLWLVRAGVFSNFWFWTWTYAREYGSIMSLADSWRLYLKFTLPWAVRPFVLWEIALAGLAAPLWSRYARAHRGFVTGFLVTSALAVCPGLYFRPHYFIFLLPAVALCVGIAVECARRELERRNRRSLAFVPLLVFAIAYLASVHGQWKTYSHLDPAALSRKLYNDGEAFPEDVTVADFVRAHAAPGDQLGIIGSEPEICFYTRLRCAGGYIYMYPLMERQRFAKQMQQEMRQEFESTRPRFVVYVDDSWSWNWEFTLQENRPFFDWAWGFVHREYELVDEVLVTDNRGETSHLWGDRPMLYVFRRTDLPPRADETFKGDPFAGQARGTDKLDERNLLQPQSRFLLTSRLDGLACAACYSPISSWR
jgi:hypothetical protein